MAASSIKNLLKSNHSSEWLTLSVNLRVSQYEALARLANEFGISPSRATRRIVDSFLSELEGERRYAKQSRR
jgi:hypothetical protein